MTLEELKEEYKKSITVETMDSKREYDKLIDEIDEADDLDEFIRVAGAWANRSGGETAEQIILKRIVEEA